jgi:UMF1 family MFS transporter
MNNPKLIKAWCMYDWANSAFTLTIGAAVFPAYWSATAKGKDGGDVIDFFGIPIINSVLYSYTLSFAFLGSKFFHCPSNSYCNFSSVDCDKCSKADN